MNKDFLQFRFSSYKMTNLEKPIGPSRSVVFPLLKSTFGKTLNDLEDFLGSDEKHDFDQAINHMDAAHKARAKSFKSETVPSSFLSEVLKLCINSEQTHKKPDDKSIIPLVSAKRFIISKGGNRIRFLRVLCAFSLHPIQTIHWATADTSYMIRLPEETYEEIKKVKLQKMV